MIGPSPGPSAMKPSTMKHSPQRQDKLKHHMTWRGIKGTCRKAEDKGAPIKLSMPDSLKMLKKVKASGGIINTECAIDESIEFVSKFFGTRSNKLSGRLIHVRDNWSNIEKIIDQNLQEKFWKLRRVEQLV